MFSTKIGVVLGSCVKVNWSAMIAKLTSRCAVAGDPIAETSSRRFRKDVTVVGVPARVAVVAVVERVIPVPDRAVAVNDNGLLDAAVAVHVMGAG